MAKGKLTTEEVPTLDVKKGDKVRLLLPLWDGTQYFNASEEIHWPFDHPPSTEQACLATEKATPLTAPVQTDGKPPAGYIDPRTGGPLAAPETT